MSVAQSKQELATLVQNCLCQISSSKEAVIASRGQLRAMHGLRLYLHGDRTQNLQKDSHDFRIQSGSSVQI